MKRKSHFSFQKRPPSYEVLEPRNLLAADIPVGNLNSGVAVSDAATGIGFIMYSEEVVHSRFSSVPADNADHFIATRLDGIQWQYNNDTNWFDFEPTATDVIVANLNFDSDKVWIPSGYGVQSIPYGWGEDLRFAPNKYGAVDDVGEFQVLGSKFNSVDSQWLGTSETKIQQISRAAFNFESVTYRFPKTANYAEDGTPLLSWRVHMLPFLGMEDLYYQFNLDEPWDSPTNLPLASQMPEAYASPHFSSDSETSFLAVTGTNTIFPTFADEITYSSITDGSHTTLMFVEADLTHKVVWSKPGDLSFDPATPLAGLGNIAPEGFAVVMADGNSHTLPATIDPYNFTNMAIRNDGNFVDFSEFGPYNRAVENLRQITLASHNHESAYRRFPAHAIYSEDGSTPLLSWRVQLLPFLEHNDLYEQFHLDEPWDSPHNLSLLPMMPKIYAHPDVANGMTNFLGVSGPGTIFELNEDGTKIAQITDGTSNTVMFVEADADLAVEWTRPVDWVPDLSDPTAGLGGILPDGRFNVAFADGSTRIADPTIEDAEFAKMLTRAGNEVADFSSMPIYRYTPNQLLQFALAALNYESAHQHFPKHATYSDDGTPLLSWRVQILPFLEQNALYDMFHHDEPWDSPHNLSLLPLMPEIFQTEGIADGFTVFQAASGPDTLFPFSDTEIGFGHIADGPSNTAMFLQVDADRAVEWTRPIDLPFDPTDPGDGLGQATASGFYFVNADGGTHFYDNTIGDETLEFLLQKNDGVPFKPDYVDSPTLYGRSIETQNDLRQLTLAAHNYESAYQRFPAHAIYSPRDATGTPVLSWRVELLPYLDHQDLYDMFNHDEPWDSPHNLSLIPLMPEVFRHPMVENGKTVYQAVTTPFDDGEPDSMFPVHYRGTTFGSITDGSSNTLMFAETNIDQAVFWTQPDDIMFDPSDPAFGLGEAYFGIGSHIAMGDGSAHFIENCFSPEQAASVILANDGTTANIHDGCPSGVASVVGRFGVAYGDEIAPDKQPLMPGETATFENYSSFIDGITKLNLDIGRLPSPFSIGADDFVFRIGNGNEHSDFTDLGVAPTVSVAANQGDNESDQVTLEFPAGTITNTWLQITVLANENTGLNSDYTVYFGSVIGETGNDPSNAIVNLADVALARQNQTGFGTAEPDNAYDINRDGRVNLVDVSLIRQNQSGFSTVNLITAPDGTAGRDASGGKDDGGFNDQSDRSGLSNGLGGDLYGFGAKGRFAEFNSGFNSKTDFGSGATDDGLITFGLTAPISDPSSNKETTSPTDYSNRKFDPFPTLELYGSLDGLFENESAFDPFDSESMIDEAVSEPGFSDSNSGKLPRKLGREVGASI